MATILCVTSGLPSLVYPSVELARRLAVTGHRVIYASLPGARQLAENHRLEFLPLEPSRYGEFLEADAAAGPWRRLSDLRRRRERARASLAVEGFVRGVRQSQPDLVLINGEMHEHVIAAVGAGAAVALLNTFMSIWRRPGLPPLHCLVRPGVGWRGSRAGTALLWLALRLRKRLRARLQEVRRLGCDRLTLLRSLARETGFDFRRETDDRDWLIPFSYRRLPVLCLHALEFEFPHRPPQGVSYVGPMVLESRIDRPLPSGERQRLDTILARCRRAGGERRLIYAGFGSAFSADSGLVRRLLAVVAARPDWELVISLGGRVAPGELEPLPARAHAFAWLPQLELLRHADAAVTHGGMGTIDECVLAGVPMLVYCGFETDMAGNTARVVHHGLGIAGERGDATAVICGHLDRLLGEPHFTDSVERLRASCLAYAEQRVAERAVERLLAAVTSERSAPGLGGAEA